MVKINKILHIRVMFGYHFGVCEESHLEHLNITLNVSPFALLSSENEIRCYFFLATSGQP